MMATGLSNKERIIWIVLSVTLLVVSVFVISKYQSTEKRAIDLEGAKTALTQREANLTLEIADLKTQLQKSNELIKTLPATDPEIIKKLERLGVQGGSKEIIDDLLKHNQLIPYKGVLGGKMSFFKEQIFVLTDKWVIADFEDGHIGGKMLLSYSVKNGTISWKVIDFYLLR